LVTIPRQNTHGEPGTNVVTRPRALIFRLSYLGYVNQQLMQGRILSFKFGKKGGKI
jgi:hypothetical protein